MNFVNEQHEWSLSMFILSYITFDTKTFNLFYITEISATEKLFCVCVRWQQHFPDPNTQASPLFSSWKWMITLRFKEIVSYYSLSLFAPFHIVKCPIVCKNVANIYTVSADTLRYKSFFPELCFIPPTNSKSPHIFCDWINRCFLRIQK